MIGAKGQLVSGVGDDLSIKKASTKVSAAHLNQSDVFLAAWLSAPAAPLPTSSLIAPLIAHHHRSFMASGKLLTSSSLHPEPIRDSPSRMSWSEPTESSSGWQLPPPPQLSSTLLPQQHQHSPSPLRPAAWFNLFGNIRIGMFSPASLQSEIGRVHWSLTV